jgi:hypothetical protein
MDVAGVLLHGAMSCSSLLLPLPKKRNFSSPMIWPEFRFHSITFALRHVIATVGTIAKLWPEHWILNFSARLLLVLAVTRVASFITDVYGDREQRTTNSMPYPESVDDRKQKNVKLFYTRAQFGATATVFIPDATLNYAPLLAIQMAPLLMTLVRKGKVGALTYHRVYALALGLGYVANGVVLFRLAWSATPSDIRMILLHCAPAIPVARLLRMYRRTNVETTWLVSCAWMMSCYALGSHYVFSTLYGKLILLAMATIAGVVAVGRSCMALNHLNVF